MGRVKKGKKQNIIANREDLGSGEEEKMPAKRRGRPLKNLKNEIQEEDKEVDKVEEVEDEENTNGVISDKDIKIEVTAENGKKRRRPSQVKENHKMAKEANGVDTKSKANDSIKPVGFRQNGSRRKNKPRRAAEVGVECR